MAKWSELEAQGVARCCAMLYNRATKKSRRCKRRAAEPGHYDKGGKPVWCAKHAIVMHDAAKSMEGF